MYSIKEKPALSLVILRSLANGGTTKNLLAPRFLGDSSLSLS
jgi:hypothetical protein